MDNKKFGEFIAELRKEKNMTQNDLAKELNLTDKAISKWERGLSFPDITIWEPLAQALDISLVELIKAEKVKEDEKIVVEDIVSETVKISTEEVNKNKKQSKVLVIIISILLILYIIATVLLNIIPGYDEQLKYSQEYLIGKSNIKGEVNIEYFEEKGSAFEIEANKNGYAVFKNPDKAFWTLKQEYSKGINLIQREFNLLPLTKATFGLYKTYGRQVTTGTLEEKSQARFVAQFMDIYENSF